MIAAACLLTLLLQTSTGDGIAPLRQQWAHNLHVKQVKASVAEYAPDADFIDPSGKTIRGAADLRKLFQTITATFDSDLAFHSQRVESSGELTYDVGSYTETLTTRATSKVQKIAGSYLTIYRRQKGGAWLIVEQVWTAGAAAR